MEEEEALDPPWAAKSSVSARPGSNSDWAKRMVWGDGGRERGWAVTARRNRAGFSCGTRVRDRDGSETRLAGPIKYFGLRFPQLAAGAGADGN